MCMRFSAQSDLTLAPAAGAARTPWRGSDLVTQSLEGSGGGPGYRECPAKHVVHFFSLLYHQLRFWRFLCDDLGLAQAPFFSLELADPVLAVLFEGQIFNSGTRRGPALQKGLQD